MNIQRRARLKAVLEQLRHPDKRTWIVLSPDSIGQTAVVCALARAFVQTHGYGMTIVVPPEHLAITRMYAHRLERVVVLERSVISDMQRYFPPDGFEVDVPFSASPAHLGDTRIDSISDLFKFPDRGGMSTLDVYRYLLMLPWDARLERPCIADQWNTEARELAATLGMEEGNSVLLFPANCNDLPQFPEVFWTTLVARLQDSGRKVYCDMQGGAVAGAMALDVPLHLALPLAGIAGRTIAPLNGMQVLQLLAGRGGLTNLVAQNDHCDDHVKDGGLRVTTSGMVQFMYPELCRGVAVDEFAVPLDGNAERLQQLAAEVAQGQRDGPGRLVRADAPADDFAEQAQDWLACLADPVTPQ